MPGSKAEEFRPETSKSRRPASSREIVKIVGPLSDDAIARIMKTGASAADVMTAFARLSSDDDLDVTIGHPAAGTVGAVLDILMAERPDDSDR